MVHLSFPRNISTQAWKSSNVQCTRIALGHWWDGWITEASPWSTGQEVQIVRGSPGLRLQNVTGKDTIKSCSKHK